MNKKDTFKISRNKQGDFLSVYLKICLPAAAHLSAFRVAKCCPCHDRDPSRGFDPGHAPCLFPGHAPGHDLGCGVDCCDEMRI